MNTCSTQQPVFLTDLGFCYAGGTGIQNAFFLPTCFFGNFKTFRPTDFPGEMIFFGNYQNL